MFAHKPSCCVVHAEKGSPYHNTLTIVYVCVCTVSCIGEESDERVNI